MQIHRRMTALTRQLRCIAILVVGAVILKGAAAAQASDFGGYGDLSGCSNPIAVATASIYGSRAHLASRKIAELQLRWSWSCHGSWSPVVLYGGMYSSSVQSTACVQAWLSSDLDTLNFHTNGAHVCA